MVLSVSDDQNPLTPPEWLEWNLWAKLAYVVVLVGGMALVGLVAKWVVYSIAAALGR